MATVYKAVLVYLRQKDELDNETIRSSCATDPHQVEYVVGDVILPPIEGSFLYAFEDLPSAQKYIGNSKDSILSGDAVLRVYEAEAMVVDAEPYYTLEDIDKFWAEKWWHFGEGWPYVMPCLPGTVWCSAIRLKDLAATDGRTLKVKKKPQPSYANSNSGSRPRPQYSRYR